MKVGAERPCTLSILQLSHEPIDVEHLRVKRIPLRRWCKQLSHNKEPWVRAASDLEKVLDHVNRRTVCVVQSESIKDRSHLRHILTHVLPQVGAVCRALAVSQLDTVAPYVDLSFEVVKVHFSSEVHVRTSVGDPTIVDHFRLLRVVKHREVRINERIALCDF